MSYRLLSTGLVAAIAGVSLLASCGPQAEQAPLALPEPVEKDSSGWIVKSSIAPDRSVRYLVKEMPREDLERTRNEYRQTSLIPVPVDPKYNAQLFKISGADEFANAVFLAPKLFAYGRPEKGRMGIRRYSDGTVGLSFPVILVDGTKSNVAPPSQNDATITVPDTLRVNDLTGLRAQISGTLSVLPGCPKQVTIKVGSTEYDATPTDLARGDNCQLEVPFTVSARVSEDEALYILQHALYANVVDVVAVYETRVPFTVSKMSIEFNKAKLFESLEAELNIKAGVWLDVDARTKLEKVVKTQAMKIQMQGDIGSHIGVIVDQAIREFFVPLRPDPQSGIKECQGTSVVCMRLNYNYSKQEESFKAEWVHTSDALTGQNYITWAKLQPLQDSKVNIGVNGKPALKNDGSRVETGLTVVPKDLLEITPAYVTVEKRDLEIPAVSTTHNNVCVATEPVYERRCLPMCHLVPVGNRCVRTEDRWVETTTYSMALPAYTTYNDPVAVQEQLFGGLELGFEWTDAAGKKQTQTCPLSAFNRHGNGQSMTVRIENRPGCKVFPENDPEVRPILFIRNVISNPTTYKTGSDIRDWTGTQLQKHGTAQYGPSVLLGCTVGIRGYSFSSTVTQ